jgi:hypothetical protein
MRLDPSLRKSRYILFSSLKPCPHLPVFEMLHPPDRVDQSYAESYARSKNLPSDVNSSSFAPTAGGDRESYTTKYSTKAILTDRGQYMSYLECQLERVTASLLAHGSLEKRMVAMDEAMSMVDDRISSMTKVAKLSQVCFFFSFCVDACDLQP